MGVMGEVDGATQEITKMLRMAEEEEAVKTVV